MVQWLAPWTLNPIIRVQISVGPLFHLGYHFYQIFYNYIINTMNQDKPLFPSLQSEDSPLAKAPESIQNYLKSLKSGLKELPPIPHGFEAKPSPKHSCTKVLESTDKFIYCQDCAKDQVVDEMIFCLPCFDKKAHEGHKTVEKVVGNNQCSCDCGRKLRLNPASFCAIHTDKKRVVELNEEEAQKFISFFGPLFEILFYLKGKEESKLLLESISKTLRDLCGDSLYYVRLITKLLNNKAGTGQSESRIWDKILENSEFCSLLLQMAGDEEFLLEFGQEFIKKEAEGNLILFSFDPFRRELMDSQQFLLKMAKKGTYFPEEINSYFNIAAQSENENEKNTLITDFFTNVASKIEPSEYIDIVCNVIRQQDCTILNHESFVREIISNMLSGFKSPQVKQEIKQEMKEEKKEGEEPKKKEKQEEKEISNEDKLVLRKTLSVLSKILEHKSNQNIAKYETILTSMCEKQGFKENLDNLVEKVVKAKIFGQLLVEKYRKMLLMALLIIQNHKKKSELLLAIWQSIMIESKPFNQNLDNIYDFISFLANSYRSFVSLGVGEEEFTSENETRESLFRSYLFQNKQVSKNELWTQFRDGWLKFKNCGKILNELCEFNNDHDTFVYKSKKTYPNALLRIPLGPSKNLQKARRIQITDETDFICRSETLKKFFLIVFKGEEFYNLFQQKFIKALETIEKEPRTLERWKSKGVGEGYVIILLLIDKLCKGQENPLIREEINKIKFNIEEYRFRFTEIGSEDKIKKILCVDPPVVEIKSEQKPNEEEKKKEEKNEEQLRRQELLRKANIKKEKLQQKLKLSQKNTLQKVKHEKSSVYEQEQQNFCLSCKEREKKDNEFVNLLCLSKGNTISKILHAEESKTSIKITTNLHTIHLNCFKEMKKKNMDFNCPLCKENINCFLPYRPNRASTQTLEICWNVFNAVLVSCFNTYETGCLFGVLLEALVESLGFTELVSAKKSKNIIRLKNKSDLYLIEMLSCLYSFSNEAQKTKYQQIYKKMRESIGTCTQKQIQLFQLVILEAVFSRVTGEIDIDPTLVQNLSKYLIEEEAEIVKNTLVFITEGNSDAISSLEDLSRSKLEERQEESPVKRIEEEITSLDNIPETEQKKTECVLERKSLGINVRTPPKKLAHLHQKDYLKQISGSTKCACESQEIESVCLNCRRLFCQKCEQDKFHAQLHLGNYIILELKDAKLIINKGPKTEKHDIYFNEFMIEYKKDQDEEESDKDEDELFVFKAKKKKNKDGAKEELYRLNLNIFNDLVSKFYNLI